MRFEGTSNYVATDDLKVAVNAAVKLRRPLLVKGEPGTGKTVLAHEIAEALSAPLIEWHIKSTTRAVQGLYEYDAVARLRQAGGLTSFTFTDPSPAVVRAVHMTELRTALNEALTALGIPLPNLGTAPASGNVIMATHVQELRAATR